MTVPTGRPGDSMYVPGCKYCGMHFPIEDEKEIHEARCKAMEDDKRWGTDNNMSYKEYTGLK